MTPLDRLTAACREYAAALDELAALRKQLGWKRCRHAHSGDIECNDPGTPPCPYSGWPESDWCEYCTTRKANLTPYRAAMKRKREALKRLAAIGRRLGP